jgi:serine/threonine protein phosphatase PrpC
MGASEASGMAKEIFELAIYCGMLTSLEDAAMLAQICDLAITFENMKDGIHDLRSARGTTFVLTLQEGRKLHSIHAGDSRWRVFHEGKAVESSNDHTSVTDLSEKLLVAWAQEKYEQFDSMVQAYLGDTDAGSLKEYIANNAPSCVELCNHILWNCSPDPKLSAISSGLGTVFSHLTLNTADLKWGDVVALYTDGIGDVVCEHKLGTVFSGEDIESGVQSIAQMSEERSVKGHEGKDDCGCNVRIKDDDKSLIAYRYGEYEDDLDG